MTNFWETKSQQIEFSITTHCQAKCPLCPRTEMIDDGLEFKVYHSSIDDYKKTISEWQEDYSFPNKKVVICGDYGDPMMHPDIEEYIKVTHDANIDISIHTNGGLRSVDFYKRIGENYNCLIVFGIDGVTAESNNLYRVDVDFNKAMENMLTYAKYSTNNCQWDYLMFTYNIEECKAAMQIAEEHGIRFYPNINRRKSKYKITSKEDMEIATTYMKMARNYQGIRKIENYADPDNRYTELRRKNDKM